MYQKFPQYYGWVLLDEDTIAIAMEFIGNVAPPCGRQ